MEANNPLDLSIQIPFPNINISVSVWYVIELLLILAFIIYISFAALVVKQVYIMDEALSTGGVSSYLKTFAWLHFVASIMVFVFVLFYLL
ncbi:hypothetical protein KJ664_01380 [Patescibacteria group bacterium]|nr:hypothetical protein [Patescibacteria group bacterium]